MESLLENKILKYNPDTIIAVRSMFDLDKPGQMDEAIDLLDAWVKKQSHFVRKDFPREYLERIIILLKGSVERAKDQLDNICTLRTLLPHFFEKCDVKNDFKITKGLAYKALLPKLTKENVRILVFKYEPRKYTSKIFLHEYFFLVLVCEYLKAYDYSNGLTIIIDIRDVNITDIVPQINLTEMKQMCTIFLEGYDTRVHNLFYLSTSKAIDVIINILKKMISEKLGKRICVLKEVEELHQYISKELLPSDYGGEQQSIAELHDSLIDELGSTDNITYFKEMSKAQTIESMRTSSKYNEHFSGIAGTFRTLSFD